MTKDYSDSSIATLERKNKESLVQTAYIKLPYRLKASQKVYIFFKSIIEWMIAFFAVVLLSPFWIILAIIIRIDSKGPAMFKHARIGKNHKQFKCWKFRSMIIGTPKNIASRDFNDAEEYITRVGNFIRRTSLDEFGQLFNILSGKMWLISYRPLVAKEKSIDDLRLERGIYQLKPGITGWAQVNGRDYVSPEHKVELDEYYLRHISLWLDIKIFFLTIKKVFKKSDIKEGKISQDEEREKVHE